MTHVEEIAAYMADTPSIDAFGRMRSAEPLTLFDSKQLHDSQPLFWDDQQVSGSATASNYITNKAATRISVGAATAGKRVRQTFMRFNYQPGKSQLVFLTAVVDSIGGGSDVKRSFGFFDDDNGIFFLDDEGTNKVVRRSYTTGSAVDEEVAQSSWNLDTLDGSGGDSNKSGYTLDISKSQILVIDLEWLGVGRVRIGFVIDGQPIYVHQFLHANVLDVVYMSTPNLPLRFEIENVGSGGISQLECICGTVISEGGQQDNGVLRSESTSGTHLDANAADTLYAALGIRLKSTHLDSVVKLVRASMLAESNDNFEWSLWWNPTVAGTFTYTGQTDSCVEIATGATANTVSGGYRMDGGWGAANLEIASDVENALRLGAAIDGTPDEIVFCARPLSSNADIQSCMTWRELS